MDIVLVTVTLVSLAIAVAMGIVTMRALHLKRPSADFSPGASPAAEDGSTRGERENTPFPARRRAETRIGAGSAQAAISPEPASCSEGGRHAHPADVGRRLVLAFGLGTVVVLAIGSSAVAYNLRVARTQQTEKAIGVLELVSLDQSRVGERLAIRGVIRNPTRGDALNDVSAVVFLFDREDAFMGAREGAIVKTVLPPGTESQFEVVLPDAGSVTRYRVSFRAGAHPLPHLDRRPSPGAAPSTAGPVTAGLMHARTRLSSH